MPTDAFSATYSDWKLIRTRAVVQIVLEVPIEDADHAYNVLGGMPNSAREIWVGVARFVNAGGAPRPSTLAADDRASAPASRHGEPAPDSNTPARARKSWHEMTPTMQTGVLCADKSFQKWLGVNNETDAAILIRGRCGVNSRKDIQLTTNAAGVWRDIVADYRAWMRDPEAVP